MTEVSYVDRNYSDYIHVYEIVPIGISGKEIDKQHKISVYTKLLERQEIEYKRKAAKESEEFYNKQEESVTLEKILENLNIPTKYVGVVFWILLFAVFIGIPGLVIAIIVFILMRRKKKKEGKR